MRIGAVWGLGHGISAIIMGMVAFFLKGRLSSYSHSTLIPKLSLYTEVLIGVSLIVIGLLGLKEAAAFHAPKVIHLESDGPSGSGPTRKVRTPWTRGPEGMGSINESHPSTYTSPSLPQQNQNRRRRARLFSSTACCTGFPGTARRRWPRPWPLIPGCP